MKRNSQAFARTAETLLRQTHRKVGTPGLVLLCLFLCGYLFAEPWLESRLGVDLPGLHDGVGVAVDTPTTSPKPPRGANPTRNRGASSHDTIESLIRSDRDVYKSPAGLRYTRGSQHGHRLRHLMAHTSDQPDRPVHGVFDVANVKQAVALVDTAYQQALTGRQTKTRIEGDRTVYVVNMGRRVGYVGGKSGARRGHPPARHIELVVIEDRLITAYPSTP